MSISAKRGLLALAFVAIVLLVVWRWTSRSSEPRANSAAAAPAETARPATRAEPAPAELEAPAARDEAPAHVAETAPRPAEAAAHPTAQRVPDLAAREWITFHVQNSKGFPVGGAEIELNGLRTQRERGSHYMWRGDPSLGKTAADGNLKLAYPVWVNLDDETGEISFTVTHPDYATYESSGRKVEPRIEVELALGSVLVVSGWIGDPAHVVTDVEAEFDWSVDVKPDDWLPRRDGRLTTTRVPRGKHIVYLRHKSDEHGLMYSDVTEFVIDSGETVELHLELKPALQLTGRLDDAVPRPIVDGRVVLAAQRRVPGASGALLRTFDMPVRADGTFGIGGIMPGDIQIIALCKGWASKEQQLTHDDLDSADTGGEMEWVAQIVDLNGPLDDFVVAMEPTAALEVVLRAPDGTLLPGAVVNAWPNACWRVGACGMFLDGRDWSAATDERGVAHIDDIPAGEHGFGIVHDTYDLPLDPPGDPNARRMRNETFKSGEVLRREYTLERRGGG